MARAFVAAEFGRGDGQHGPEPLAARIDQVPGKFGDQFDVRARLGQDDRIHLGHAGGDKPQERLQRRRWAGAFPCLHD